jgi:hypothetical protein
VCSKCSVCAEAARAAEIMASLSLDPADAMSSSASVDGSMGALGDEDSAHAIWSELCAPSSFFSAHKSYVQINIGSTSADQHAVWYAIAPHRLITEAPRMGSVCHYLSLPLVVLLIHPVPMFPPLIYPNPQVWMGRIAAAKTVRIPRTRARRARVSAADRL